MPHRAFTVAAACLAAAGLFALLPPRACGPGKEEPAAAEAEAKAAVAAQAIVAAMDAEARAVVARPRAAAARRKARAATEGREAAIPLEALPAPVQVEIEALSELADELEEQIGLEAARGDAWKEAAEAEHEAAEAEHEAAEAMAADCESRARAAWWRGAKVGAVVAAAVAVVLILL
jgi:hypothetical protein